MIRTFPHQSGGTALFYCLKRLQTQRCHHNSVWTLTAFTNEHAGKTYPMGTSTPHHLREYSVA